MGVDLFIDAGASLGQYTYFANKAMRKGPDAPAGPSEVELLAEIRDELRKRA